MSCNCEHWHCCIDKHLAAAAKSLLQKHRMLQHLRTQAHRYFKLSNGFLGARAAIQSLVAVAGFVQRANAEDQLPKDRSNLASSSASSPLHRKRAGSLLQNLRASSSLRPSSSTSNRS